ncbi:MAG: flagellar hook protein FlgE [Deltaproteobacteria bacterium]|nr:flagellar hook protein FlgE [Deltaproteobacteria bacterium]
MGILSSMYTGITGLQANGEALGIYGDNLANANTAGFKTSRPEFQDVIAKSLKGILGGNQIGRGTKLTNITTIFSQGSVVQTERATDLAISGDGFFVMDGVDGRSFTRAGAFNFDKEGKLSALDGSQVMGFMSDETGQITNKLGAIKLDRSVIDAKQTGKVNLSMNLDIRADKGKDFDLENPDKTTQYSNAFTVYDSAGNSHLVTTYFNKTDDGVWAWHATVKGDEIQGGEKGKLIECANGTLKFSPDGRLQETSVGKNEFNFNKGARSGQKITFDFGRTVAEGGMGLQTTQYGTNSDLYKHTQDGYSAGTVAGLSFNEDGVLSAIYTNGETQNIAQVAICKFENNESLFKAGGNKFRESRNSGQAFIGKPGEGGRGRINPKSMESSTTDIASEFINLMTTQRSFQANSRAITVADELMQEVLNMRRQ